MGLAARAVYLLMDLKMFGRSMLPYSPAPDWLAGRWADPPSEVSVSTSIGELLSMASMIPKEALEPMNRPCPITTAGLPVALPVGISHNCCRLLVPDQDGLNPVLLTIEKLEDLARATPWYAEYVLDSGFLQGLDRSSRSLWACCLLMVRY